MPSTQSLISSTTNPLLANGVFTSNVEKILNYTGADITLVSDTHCSIVIFGGGTINGPWENIFQSPTTSPSVGYSATYLTKHPYSYLTITNLDAVPQTFLTVSHILRVHSHIVETLTSGTSITANVNLNQVGGVAFALGSAPSVSSIPVVIAPDNIVNVNGTVFLAYGTSVGIIGNVLCDIASGSTIGINGTVITDLASVSGSAITLGSKVSASSMPVVIASDQSFLTVKTKPTYSVSIDTITNTSQTIRSSAGVLHTVIITSLNTSFPLPSLCDYVKIYNSSSATSSDTPLATFPIRYGEHLIFQADMNFSAGLCVRATSSYASGDNSVPASTIYMTDFITGYSE